MTREKPQVPTLASPELGYSLELLKAERSCAQASCLHARPSGLQEPGSEALTLINTDRKETAA